MAEGGGDREQSRTEYVFEVLRADMLEGRLAPGERLKLPALTQRFAVSMTVIREALTRLAEQRLVLASPKRGFSVMPLTPDDLADLTHVRVRIETMVLRDSIERATLSWEKELVSAHYGLTRTPYLEGDGSLSPAWLRAHRTFHHALGAGCGSPRLVALADSLRDSAELYRAWTRTLAHDYERDVPAEHDDIARAALAHDAVEASAALRAHIERTTTVLLEYAASEPDS